MSECYDAHACLMAGHTPCHKPFEGETINLLVGEEAEQFLRRWSAGELLGIPVLATISYDSDHPENREAYVWAADEEDPER